jgi:tripartite-type tricarboxylate transporter receptor subunit TctC
MRKRSFVQGAAAALALAGVPGFARAETWPARPVHLVVAFAAGGTGDIVARLLARKLGESLGQQVVIDNRPIPVAAVSMVAHAKPDGYTLVMAGSGTALTSALFTKLPYDLLKDLTCVSTLATFDLALVTDSQSGLRSVADVMAFAKAHPGRLNIGTARTGSTQNLAAEMLKAQAGLDVVIVPFKTTGELLAALRARDVQVAIEMLPAIHGQIAGNTMRALAVTANRRNPGLPQVPTLAESGLTGFEASSWNGIAVPAGTPPDVVQRLAREIAKAVAAPDLQRELLSLGITAKASTPEEMARRMGDDIAKWRGVIEKAGIPRQ